MINVRIPASPKGRTSPNSAPISVVQITQLHIDKLNLYQKFMNVCLAYLKLLLNHDMEWTLVETSLETLFNECCIYSK